MKILIVDDEITIRTGLAYMIGEDYGNLFEIDSADSAYNGIDKALAIQPDVIMVDINMPAMDGLSMIAALREKGYAGHFIVLTGYSEYDYAVRALRLRVLDYLLKPIDQDQLYHLLDQICTNAAISNERSAYTNVKRLSHHMQAILSFIDKSYTDIQTVEQIAQYVHLHPNYVSTLFRKEIGVPVIQYVNNRRVERAKEMLADETLTMETVAEAVGFQTTRNFYKVFKQVLGISPGQYRRTVDQPEQPIYATAISTHCSA